MPRKSGPGRVPSEAEAFRRLSQGLRVAAVRPSIHGYAPHPKQIEFHSSTAKLRALFGGNRSGKTVGGATEAVFRATGVHPYQNVKPPPVDLRVVAVDFKDGVEKIVKPEIARWMPPSQLQYGSWEESYDRELRTLTLANGSTIEFMSYEQDTEKFAGTSRDGVWYDEEPPRDIWVECQMRLIDKGGCAWMTMTPLEGMNWVYDEVYLRANSDPNIEVWEVDITDNPHLNSIEIEAIMSGLTPDEREARMKGKFVQIGGLIYKEFSEKNIIAPFIPPKDWLWVASLDHGLSNPTAWGWFAVAPDGRAVLFDEWYKSGHVVSFHAQKVHQINALHERVPDYYVGDPSIRNVDPITGTSILIEYINHGIPIVLGNNDVQAGINLVLRKIIGFGKPPQNYPMFYVTSNCVNTIREHQRYRWAKWQSRRATEEHNKKEEPVKKDDHTCDMVRYFFASRPAHEDGQTIPEKKVPAGATQPVDPYNSVAVIEPDIDEGDYHLGREY